MLPLENSENKYTVEVYSTAVLVINNGNRRIVKHINDYSLLHKNLSTLAEAFTELKLSPLHLEEVLHDLLGN